MKTLTRITLMSALLTLPFHAMAEDQNVDNRGMGYGQHMMGGGGYYDFCDECGTYHMHGPYLNKKALSEKEAKEKLEKYVAKHLKGFTITKMDKANMPMGTMYWVVVQDKNGNEMEIHMNPWGYIRGPFIK